MEKDTSTSLNRKYKKLYDELYNDPALANLSPKTRKAIVEQDPKLILLKWELEKKGNLNP